MQTLNDKKQRAPRRGFTACTHPFSLLETTVAVEQTAAGGVRILLSPVGSSFDRFQNFQQQRREAICSSVKSISWGGPAASPKMHGESSGGPVQCNNQKQKKNLSPRGFLRENHGTIEPIKSTS